MEEYLRGIGKYNHLNRKQIEEIKKISEKRYEMLKTLMQK
jgi:hypothetical protein